MRPCCLWRNDDRLSSTGSTHTPDQGWQRQLSITRRIRVHAKSGNACGAEIGVRQSGRGAMAARCTGPPMSLSPAGSGPISGNSAGPLHAWPHLWGRSDLRLPPDTGAYSRLSHSYERSGILILLFKTNKLHGLRAFAKAACRPAGWPSWRGGQMFWQETRRHVKLCGY